MDDMGSQIREGRSAGIESPPVLVLLEVSTDEIKEIPPDVDPLTGITETEGGNRNDLTLDIDRNGRLDALTDGLMIVRYMFGSSGDIVVRDSVARDGMRTDAVEITSYLDELGLVLDVDGNGELTAQTDGIMIIRALFGFSGDIVVRDALAPGAPRDMAEVTAYLEDMKVMSAPSAGNDSAIVSLGTTGTIDALANDTDINGDELSITGFSATSSQGGAIARDGNSLHYTPANGFRGTDSFEYRISDSNGGTDSVTVTIKVPNAAPEAVNDEATVSFGSVITIMVLANDTDINNDELLITNYSTLSSQGNRVYQDFLNHSFLIFNSEFKNGVNTNSFEYSISDGNGGTDSATVTITILNEAPKAVNDSVTVEVGTTGTIDVLENDVLANDSEVNDDFLTITDFSTTSSLNVAPEAVNDEATVEVGATGTINVLANDTDINSDVLSVTGFSTTSSRGSMIARDGNNLLYTPDSIGGIDSFMYSISDAMVAQTAQL
ncbi:MAG: tandem-95 repeat protein [Hormoscilla sp. SP12CHS1]|nr:tandem-95 repeat protein [Hormoscilla sp. SP12CHS1]